jgi:glucosylceramidase
MAETINIWLTTPDQKNLLQEQVGILFSDTPTNENILIEIDDSKSFQEMDGFGASFTDSSAWLLAHCLDDEKRDEVMRKLFDPIEGVGLSYIRQPMGSSDFALRNYTYNDIPEGETDFELNHFSIEYDKPYIIPMLKKAIEINPAIKVMGSPWSAPAWMKTNGSLIQGKLREDCYEVFANYFVKYIQAYEREGIPIHAITIQNEPDFEPEGYPGMRMTANEQTEFVKNHLGPAFENAGIKTKIIVWDHNWDQPDFPIEVLNNPEARKYISGSSFHGYGGEIEAQLDVHNAHPDKDIYFTEQSGGCWATDFPDNLKYEVGNLIVKGTRYWAKTIVKWNMALDENHGPQNGGCPDCRGVIRIHQKTGEVTFNQEYYTLGHGSKVVRPGARRIESSVDMDSDVINVAFKNPDGSIALVVVNKGEKDRSFSVKNNNKYFTYSIPTGAAASFCW